MQLSDGRSRPCRRVADADHDRAVLSAHEVHQALPRDPVDKHVICKQPSNQPKFPSAIGSPGNFTVETSHFQALGFGPTARQHRCSGVTFANHHGLFDLSIPYWDGMAHWILEFHRRYSGHL